MKNTLNQAGDTIVEVLIAIAVLSLVLAGAYAISSRDLQGVQRAQEHTTALKLAETQIEQLRAAGSEVITPGSPFCFNRNNAISTATLTSMTPPADTNFSDYNNNCQFSNGITYYVAILRDDTASADKSYKFSVYVSWDSIDGPGHDQLKLVYSWDQLP